MERAAKDRGVLGKALAGAILGPLQLTFASTPAGKVLLLSLVIGLAISLKTGSNQVMLATAFILGLLVADSLANFVSTRMVKFRFGDVPEEIWAGRECRIGFVVTNEKPFLPAGDMSAEVTFSTAAGRQVKVSTAVAQVPGGASVEKELKVRFPWRGEVSGAGVAVVSAFPMGFLLDRRKFRLPIRAVVYPRLGRVAPDFLRELGSRSERARRTVSNALTGDTSGLREYRPGDSLKRVYWRASAHRRKLVVREFEETRCTDLIMALDAFLPSPAMRGDLEWLISLAATLLVHGASLGWRTRLVVGSSSGLCRVDVEGRGRLSEALRQLALLQPSRLDNSDALIRAAVEPGRERAPVLLLTLATQPPRSEEVIVVNRLFRPDILTILEREK